MPSLIWLLTQDCRAQAQRALDDRAVGISAQILREKEGNYAALVRCQKENLVVTGWLSWFLEQHTAAAAAKWCGDQCGGAPGSLLVEQPVQRLQQPPTETSKSDAGC